MLTFDDLPANEVSNNISVTYDDFETVFFLRDIRSVEVTAKGCFNSCPVAIELLNS